MQRERFRAPGSLPVTPGSLPVSVPRARSGARQDADAASQSGPVVRSNRYPLLVTRCEQIAVPAGVASDRGAFAPLHAKTVWPVVSGRLCPFRNLASLHPFAFHELEDCLQVCGISGAQQYGGARLARSAATACSPEPFIWSASFHLFGLSRKNARRA